MAFPSDYGGIKPSVLTYEPYKATIETISALLLLYPICELEYSLHGVTYHFFEKTFWGKKQKGFLQMEYLPGKHGDSSYRLDDNGNPFPAYMDLFIGIYYGSEYASVQWSEQFRKLIMQSPEKQVLSYGKLLENITARRDAISQGELEIMQENSGSSWDMLTISKLESQARERKMLDRVANTLDFFKKFHQLSDFQPIPNEQQQL